jgi:hypothetical protein
MERLRGAVKTEDAKNLAILLFAVLLLWVPRLEGAIDLRWDAGAYYILGTALAEGRGYRLLNEPGEIEAVQYPPLLPAVVAVVQKAVGTTDRVRAGHALRLLFFALTLTYTAAIYVLARQFLPPLPSLLVGTLSSLQQETVFLTDVCFTEIPYGLVTVLFVLASRRGAGPSAGILAAAAFLLRSSGLALLAAWVGEALFRRRAGQTLVRWAVAVVVVLLWQGNVARVMRSPDYQDPSYAYQRAPYQYYNVPYVENMKYVDPFRPDRGLLSGAHLASRLAGNAARMPVWLGGAVSTSAAYEEGAGEQADTWLGDPAIAGARRLLPRFLMGLAVLAGFAWLLRQGEWLIPLYLLGALTLISMTPWPRQFPRYLAPLTPFLALGLVGTFHWLSGRSRWVAGLRSALAVLMLMALAMQLKALGALYTRNSAVAVQVDRSGTRTTARLFYYEPSDRSFDESLDWLATQAAADAVVATTAPHCVFLRTGRKAVMPPMEADPAEAQRLLDTVPVDYLIVDELRFVDFVRRYGEPAVRAHPTLWELVYDRGGVRIYLRRPTERRHERT